MGDKNRITDRISLGIGRGEGKDNEEEEEEKKEEDMTETQKTEPPLTEEEYNILRRNMSGMGSTSFRRLIEPPENKIEWSESNQELFNQLTRADTLENNPGFINPSELTSTTGDESSCSTRDDDAFSVINIAQSSAPTLTPTLSVPSTEQFHGDFGFYCAFKQLNSNQKNKFWEYSELLNKLFIEFNKGIQISFKLKAGQDYSDLSVRAMIVYAEEASVKEPVLRCPTHSSPDHETNLNFPSEHVKHVIRVDHKEPQYGVDKSSGRHSVLVPISRPAAGTDYYSCIYKFMCLCSDPGGINRRPVKLIFTLEKSTGETVGRDSLDLRICACPGRDMIKEEKRLRQKEERTRRLSSEVKTSHVKPPLVLNHSSLPKKRKTELEDMVLLPVARVDFEKLNEFAEAAMIVRSPEMKEQIISERRKLINKMN